MMQRAIWVLWPAFFMAVPAVGIVFSLFDPAEMHWLGSPVEMSRLGVYTLGFFLFWIFGACCSGLTCLLQRSPFEVNRCPLPVQDRPIGCPKRDEPGQCC
jgi:hypothetical protein